MCDYADFVGFTTETEKNNTAFMDHKLKITSKECSVLVYEKQAQWSISKCDKLKIRNLFLMWKTVPMLMTTYAEMAWNIREPGCFYCFSMYYQWYLWKKFMRTFDDKEKHGISFFMALLLEKNFQLNLINTSFEKMQEICY